MSRDRDWMADAACKWSDPELFFTVGKRESGPSMEQVAEAKLICFVCPVRQECLDYADRLQLDYGVFGGLDEWERRETAKRREQRRRDKHATVV